MISYENQSDMGEQKFTVMIEIDHGEFTMIKTTNPFTESSPTKIFNSRADAEVEVSKWNTAVVVEL